MRFRLLARRVTLAPALVLALALTVAACSSSSSTPASSSTAPASSPAVTTTSAAASSPAGASTANAAAAITTNWEKFFDSGTPVSEKVKLLQHGTALEPAIRALVALPLASNLGAKVTAVTVTSPTKAAVTYNLTSGGSVLLSGQKGTAVYQDGTWKVGTASLCGLLRLVPGGSVPAACSSAG